MLISAHAEYERVHFTRYLMIENALVFSPPQVDVEKNHFWLKQRNTKLFGTCFMDFCAQIVNWTWPTILGIIKTHRNFRMFQKHAKKLKQMFLQEKRFLDRRLQKFISLVILIIFHAVSCY